MSIDDRYEVFVWLFSLLFIALVWVGIFRPFAIRVIRLSLYRLRDELRSWYIGLSADDRQKQRFSFMFMERAINSIAASPGTITIWRVNYMAVKERSGSGVDHKFQQEIAKFENERNGKIKEIDDQHSIIFFSLLLINSPIEMLAMVFTILIELVYQLARGMSPMQEIVSEARNLKDASHQQEYYGATV